MPGKTKTKSAGESKSTDVKQVAPSSASGSREAIKAKNDPPWTTSTKSKEEAKLMKVKALASKSGSRESI